jgi:hypothetical protein
LYFLLQALQLLLRWCWLLGLRMCLPFYHVVGDINERKMENKWRLARGGLDASVVSSSSVNYGKNSVRGGCSLCTTEHKYVQCTGMKKTDPSIFLHTPLTPIPAIGLPYAYGYYCTVVRAGPGREHPATRAHLRQMMRKPAARGT